MAVLPIRSTVTVDGDKFHAYTAHVGISTDHDHNGLPQMGTLRTAINVVVDINDTDNVPFATLQKLFDLANVVTRDKIKDIKIEFWKDEKMQDAICSYTFRGWISSHVVSTGAGNNPIMTITFQPALDKMQYMDLKMRN
jgi:hypothetical protein